MTDFILAGKTLGEHAHTKNLSSYVDVHISYSGADITIDVFKGTNLYPSIYFKYNITVDSFPECIAAAHQAIDEYIPEP